MANEIVESLNYFGANWSVRIKTFLLQSPLFAISLAARRFDSHLARILQGDEITFQEALALASIFFEEPRHIKPSQLAEALSVTRGNLSHCVSSLQAKGLVRRQVVPDDGRALHVVLTQAGRACAMRIIRKLDRLQKDFETNIGPKKLEAALVTVQAVEEICAYACRLDPAA